MVQNNTVPKMAKKCNNEYTYFYDENGHFIIILSDVIGTDESTADEIKVAFELMVQSIKSKLIITVPLKISILPYFQVRKHSQR